MIIVMNTLFEDFFRHFILLYDFNSSFFDFICHLNHFDWISASLYLF